MSHPTASAPAAASAAAPDAVISGHRFTDDGALTLLAAEVPVARLAPGDEFAWAPHAERWCVGACPPGAEPRPCPAGARAAKGAGERCASCLDESRLACVRCTGARCINAARWTACNEPHVVYLAVYALGDDAVKVGVARADRVKERLREQGCWAGVPVAYATDGQEARRIEAAVRRAGWKDRVHLPAVAHLPAPHPMEVVELLDRHRARLAARLPEIWWVLDAPVTGFDRCYPQLPAHCGALRRLDPAKDCVGGSYLGARGQQLIIELPCGQAGLLPLRALRGRRVIATDLAAAGRPQLALF